MDMINRPIIYVHACHVLTLALHIGAFALGTPTYLLEDGMYESEGRVEANFSGSAPASFCDSLWGIEEATVICKHLNYTGADLALLSGYFGDVRNESLSQPAYGELSCNGFEDHLLQCNYTDVGSACPHSGKGAGVRCTAYGSLRLSNGSVPGEGRVEILGESGVWGTICDDEWDRIDAGVACRQLGYPDAIEAIVNENYTHSQPLFGPGSGPILLDGLECSGGERHLIDCPVTKEFGIHDCSHEEDAGVRCDTKLIRLQNGEYPNQGRVEVYHGGSWGTICSWNVDAAHIACRELGYPLGALENTSVAGGDGRVLLDEVFCSGNESHVRDCDSLGWAKVQSCSPNPHPYQLTAGVICNDPANFVRLLSGSTSYEGVVEYRFGSVPGFICDPDWSIAEAEVVCRQLGYQYGRNERPVSLGPLSGTIFYHDYQCNGTEEHLGECQVSLSSDFECEPTNIAQVRCGPPKEFDLRLMGSDYTEQGRVDVYYNNEWSSITDDYFFTNVRQTICRQLGYEGSPSTYYSYNLFESGSGRIVIDGLYCGFFDSKITDCSITFTGNESLNTRDDELEVLCAPYVSVANHPVRLVNEKGVINRDYGRVEILHDGLWGSICDDYTNDGTADLICSQLGHDITYARSLRPSSYDIPFPVREWFSFISCNWDSRFIFQCRFSPWGYVDTDWCYSGRHAGVQCIETLPFVTTSEAPVIPDSSSPMLTQWEIFLIAVAFLVPVMCVIICCYQRQRSKGSDRRTIADNTVYSSSANNGAGSVIVATPPPRYISSPSPPTELPPSYDSVMHPSDQSYPPTDNVNLSVIHPSDQSDPPTDNVTPSVMHPSDRTDPRTDNVNLSVIHPSDQSDPPTDNVTPSVMHPSDQTDSPTDNVNPSVIHPSDQFDPSTDNITPSVMHPSDQTDSPTDNNNPSVSHPSAHSDLSTDNVSSSVMHPSDRTIH
nr:deleted in malignant brain tumors 1 protein-like [Lytechinus pictus]